MASKGTREGNPTLRKGGPTPLSAQLHPRQPSIEGEDKALDIKSSKNHCGSIGGETIATKFVNPWNLTVEQFFNLLRASRLTAMDNDNLADLPIPAINLISYPITSVRLLRRINLSQLPVQSVITVKRKNSCWL